MESNTAPSLNYNKRHSTMPLYITSTRDKRMLPWSKILSQHCSWCCFVSLGLTKQLSWGNYTEAERRVCVSTQWNKSLCFYFSSRQLLHSAASMSFCMTQRPSIPKGHKFWQLCFLLAVSVKTLDFYFDPSEENQSFWRKPRRQAYTDNRCSFDFFLFFGRQQMPHPTVTLLALKTNILLGFPSYYLRQIPFSVSSGSAVVSPYVNANIADFLPSNQHMTEL